MAKWILMEEFHVGVYVQRKLPEDACSAIRQVLDTKRFRIRLRRAIREATRQYPTLNKILVKVSR